MIKRVLLLLALLASAGWASSQSTIAYSEGPGFPIPSEFAPAALDLDRDGSPDFSFIAGFPLCTMDVPCSLCTMSFYVTALGTNALLTQGYYASILSAGEWIGPTPTSNSLWSTAGTTTLLTWWWSQRYGTAGAWGPLAELGQGYLGVRFCAPDGQHYGWIHMRETAVLDWAYEIRPDTPIKAGAKPIPVPLATPGIIRPGFLRLEWPSEIGKAYQVQAKAHVDAFTWTNLNFAIPASATNTMVDLPMTGAAQFFRVVEGD